MFTMDPSAVRQIEVPVSLVRDSVGFSFDLGGSRCKFAYMDTPNDQKDTVTMHLGWFNLGDFQDALQYIKVKGHDLKNQEAPVLHATGISCQHANKDAIEKTFNVRVQIVPETETLARGFMLLAHSAPKRDVVLPPSEDAIKHAAEARSKVQHLSRTLDSIYVEQEPGARGSNDTDQESGSPLRMTDPTLPYAQSDPDLFPAILGSFGTGTISCQVEANGNSRIIDLVFGRGGKTFSALGDVLCGTSDYQSLMSLAEKGNDSTVHHYMADAKEPGQDDIYTLVPDSQIMFCFGKMLDARTSGGVVSKEDLARGLVAFLAKEIAHQMYWYARAYLCKRVFLIGGLFHHPLWRYFVTKEFMMSDDFRPRDVASTELNVLNYGEYIVVMGSLLAGADYHKKRKEQS